MRIIVYGSLRRKQGNSHWMTNAQWLGYCQLDGYAMYDLGHYPAVVVGHGKIFYEVYRISSSILTEIDALKRDGHDYKRELIHIALGNAWIYLYQHSVIGLPCIDHGDWLTRKQ